MRRSMIVVSLLLLGHGLVMAAECPPGTKTQVIGSVATTNDTTGAATGAHEITQQGHDVRMMTVSCGGTACTVGLYDTDTTVSGGMQTGAATVKAEPGAPANESRTTTFDPPLSFTEGVVYRNDGNANALLLYECR